LSSTNSTRSGTTQPGMNVDCHTCSFCAVIGLGGAAVATVAVLVMVAVATSAPAPAQIIIVANN
jgi:hypothetical protein